MYTKAPLLWLALLSLPLFACDDDSDDSGLAGGDARPSQIEDMGVEPDAEAPPPDPDAAAPEIGDIIEIASGDEGFSTLVTAIQAAGLVEALQGEGPFTVFAPTNAAFAALPEGALDGLLADPEALAEILLYHVVEGAVMADEVVGLDSATTLQGDAVSIRVEDGSVYINDAMVTVTDIEASNGVIHVIDAVLIPQAEPEPMDIVEIASANEDFSTLVTAVQAAGLVEALQGEGPFTVFAPTNAAFAALPEGALDGLLADPEALADILLYHVVEGAVTSGDVINLESATTLLGEEISIRVEGESVYINDAMVTMVDIEASNGVIHVIDAVLIPQSDPEPMDIIEIASANEDFSTLVTAVQAAGLVEALQGEGPFTVFAPTNAAFAALPEGVLDALIADPEALSEILLYHVVSGAVWAEDVTGLESATTLLGEEISIRVEGGAVYINDAMVTMTDIEASNGVIHVIDAVLIPQAEPEPMDIVEIASANEDFSTLVTAIEAAGLVEALQGEGPFTVFAPTNAAFDALPEALLSNLLADPEALSEVLLYHVVSGAVWAADVVGLEAATTLLGQEVSIRVEEGAVYINNAMVTMTDIEASNGVIHVIDAVLVPEPEPMDIIDVASSTEGFSTLVTAIEAAGLVEALQGEGPFTVFAPTNAAFDALPEGVLADLLANPEALSDILLYHVVAGDVRAADVITLDSATTLFGEDVAVRVQDGAVYINDAMVTVTDIEASNGVIHVIDAVLVPAR